MRRTHTLLKLSLISFFMILCISGGYRLMLFANGNFHTVVPGELYRAARPSAESLPRYAKQYGIRTVLNLRGSNPDKHWYQQEAATSKALGIQLIDLPLNSGHALSEKEMHQLITLMQDAPKPILVHCQAGADRSALASALYLLAIKHTPQQEAEAQFSFMYGHLPFSFNKAYAMDRSFSAYVDTHPTMTALAEK